MSVRIAKEYMLAAEELGLASGDYVFIAFELDIALVISRQLRPIHWFAPDYFDDEIGKVRFSCFINVSLKLIICIVLLF